MRTLAWNRRGLTSVEMALLMPFACLLIFGCIEFGALVGDWMLLAQASHELCRAASVGATLAELDEVAQPYAAALHSSDLQITYQRRTFTGTTWGPWVPLGDAADENDALNGQQVRALLQCSHRLLSGDLLSGLTGGPERTHVPLAYSTIARRE